MKTFIRRLTLTLLLAAGLPAAAQLEIRPVWDPDEWLQPDAALELELLAPPEGRLAIFLGPADVTDLFRRVGNRLVYRPELLALPRGESELVVWEAGPDGWRELARIPVRVLHRGGFERADLGLRLDVETVVDLDSGGSDPPAEEERLGGQLDFDNRAGRDGWDLRLAANVIGASEIERALRFGEEGEEADRVDLSSWSLAVTRDRYELGLGHMSWGDSRFLIQGFSSRGAQIRVPLGGPADFSLAAMNGTSIVGWDNFLGLSRSDHRVVAGTLGVEVRPAQPGALRLEVTALDGSLLPRSGFNEGDLTDREESVGWSFRLLAAPTSRFRVDASWAESEFDNPFDPLLAQDTALVPVRSDTGAARHLDLGWTILQRQPDEGRPLELAVELSHRQVDPLYRSVASFVQSDVAENLGQVRLLFGGMSGLVSYSSGRDNLDDLPSVLTTRTRRGAWSFVVPFAEVLRRGEGSPWVPVFTLSGDRTHQEGDGVPIDGGFDPSHVPDQVSLSHQAGLQWTGPRWSLEANASLADQDNRQPGREEADFEHRGHGLSLLTSPLSWLDLGVDLRQERQIDEQLAEEMVTDLLGFNWTLQLPARHVLTGSLSWSESETDPGIRTSEDLIGDAQWAWGFERNRREHGLSGRLYLRAAYRESQARDFLFGFRDDRDGWKLTAGTNLSLF